jgi:small subunit ribosomal protein S1
MSKEDSFAALMEGVSSDSSKRAAKRLRRGEVVEGTVVQVGVDAVFVDVGATKEARIEKSELMDAAGEVKLKVGDRLRATVVDARMESPRLAISLGRESGLDVATLGAALEGGTAVRGKVSKAVKAGVEVEIGGVRAFCPGSQLDLSHVADLSVYEGQELEFRVLEIKEGGRNVIVSRRALLEARRDEARAEMRERLVPGAELDGTVHGIQKHGVVVDLGGVEGFVHVSEIAHHRVERVEDAVKIGDAVRVSVLAIEETGRQLRVRLSMKALLDAPARPAAPERDEILEGTVSRATNFGIFVSTSKGEGLVPIKELGLAPGSDHRRAYPAGKPVRVTLVHRDPASGKMRFSVTAVASVEERSNYRAFSAAGQSASQGGGLGSLGDVLGAKLAAVARSAATPARAAGAVKSAQRPAKAGARSKP